MATPLQEYLADCLLDAQDIDRAIICVNNQSELEAIPATSLKEGLLVWVKAEESFYRYSTIQNKWYKQTAPTKVDTLPETGETEKIYRIDKKQYYGVGVVNSKPETDSPATVIPEIWFNTNLSIKEVKEILYSVALSPAFNIPFRYNSLQQTLECYIISLFYSITNPPTAVDVSGFQSEDDYIGYLVMYDSALTWVTKDNKYNLGIEVGTTVCYKSYTDFGNSVIILNTSMGSLICNLSMLLYILSVLGISLAMDVDEDMFPLLSTDVSPKYYFCSDDLSLFGLTAGWHLENFSGTNAVVVDGCYGLMFESCMFASGVSDTYGVSNEKIKKIVSEIPYNNGNTLYLSENTTAQNHYVFFNKNINLEIAGNMLEALRFITYDSSQVRFNSQYNIVLEYNTDDACLYLERTGVGQWACKTVAPQTAETPTTLFTTGPSGSWNIDNDYIILNYAVDETDSNNKYLSWLLSSKSFDIENTYTEFYYYKDEFIPLSSDTMNTMLGAIEITLPLEYAMALLVKIYASTAIGANVNLTIDQALYYFKALVFSGTNDGSTYLALMIYMFVAVFFPSSHLNNGSLVADGYSGRGIYNPEEDPNTDYPPTTEIPHVKTFSGSFDDSEVPTTGSPLLDLYGIVAVFFAAMLGLYSPSDYSTTPDVNFGHVNYFAPAFAYNLHLFDNKTDTFSEMLQKFPNKNIILKVGLFDSGLLTAINEAHFTTKITDWSNIGSVIYVHRGSAGGIVQYEAITPLLFEPKETGTQDISQRTPRYTNIISLMPNYTYVTQTTFNTTLYSPYPDVFTIDYSTGELLFVGGETFRTGITHNNALIQNLFSCLEDYFYVYEVEATSGPLFTVTTNSETLDMSYQLRDTNGDMVTLYLEIQGMPHGPNTGFGFLTKQYGMTSSPISSAAFQYIHFSDSTGAAVSYSYDDVNINLTKTNYDHHIKITITDKSYDSYYFLKYSSSIYDVSSGDETSSIFPSFIQYLESNGAPGEFYYQSIEAPDHGENTYNGSYIYISGSSTSKNRLQTMVTAVIGNGSGHDLNQTAAQLNTAISSMNVGFTNGVVLTEQIHKQITVCISQDTLITMGDGSHKMLKDIQIGDYIATANGVDKVVWTDIPIHKQASVYTIYHFSDDTELKIIHDHRAYSVEDQRYKRLSSFKIGEHVIKQNGEIVSLQSKEIVHDIIDYGTVYTLNENSQYANGILTGNRLANWKNNFWRRISAKLYYIFVLKREIRVFKRRNRK